MFIRGPPAVLNFHWRQSPCRRLSTDGGEKDTATGVRGLELRYQMGLRCLCQCSWKQAFQHCFYIRGCRARRWCLCRYRSANPTEGPVTAVTTCFVGPNAGSLTVCTGWALSGVSFTTLRSSVSAWLSHTLHMSTISRMGVSGGTLSRCRRRAQFGWPAMNRSRISRVLVLGPISPNALTVSVSSATANFDGS